MPLSCQTDEKLKAYSVFIVFLVFSFAYWILLQGLGWNVTLYKYDITCIYYPYYKILWESLRNFQFPGWTHGIYGGFPIFAGLEMGALYLPHLILFLLFPLIPALTVSIILHFALLGFFTQRFLRRIGVGEFSAFAGAFFYMLSGAVITHRIHLNIFFGLTWMPLGFYLLTRIEERSLFILGFSALVALMFASGHPQVLAFSLVAWSIYLLLTNWLKINFMKNLFFFEFSLCSRNFTGLAPGFFNLRTFPSLYPGASS